MKGKAEGKDESAAVLTIRRAAKMTRPGRISIAAWLGRQAQLLVEEGPDYADRYTARYLYRQKEGGRPCR